MAASSHLCCIFQLLLEISLTHSKVKVVSAVSGGGLLDALVLQACHISFVGPLCADSMCKHFVIVFETACFHAAGLCLVFHHLYYGISYCTLNIS